MAKEKIEKNSLPTERSGEGENILLQTIIDAIPDVIGIQDPKHRIIRYNEAGYRLLGMTQEDVQGRECFRLIGKDRPCSLCATSEAYVTKVPTKVTRYEDALGIWLDVRAYPVLDGNGDLLYIIEHLRDITSEKDAQESLKRSEEKFKTLVEASPDWIWEVDEKGTYIYASPKVKELIGYDTGEVVGKSPLDFMDESVKPKIRRKMASLMKDPRPFHNLENLNIRKDGSRVFLETSGIPVFDEGGAFRGYRGIDRDITSRKKAEEELRFRLNFENVLSSISTDFISMPVGSINDGINKALERIGELVDADRSYVFLYKDDGRAMDYTHEWCREGIPPVMGRLNDLDPGDYHLISKLLDTRTEIAIGSLSELPPEASPDREELERGGIRSLVIVPMFVGKMDVGVLGFDSVRAERGWSGDTIKMLKLVAEIIASAVVRKRSQEELVLEKDRAEFYLDLLGHDIGNLHQGIYSSLQLAEMKRSDARVQGIAINRAEEITKRSMSLVKTVLLLSKLRSLEPDLEPIDIPASIRQSMETINTVFPDRMIDLDIHCENGCPPVMAEPLIGELFFNLLHNAIKFQRGDIAKVQVDVRGLNGNVEVHVCDHGPGIADEMKASMFRKFKPGGSGSKSGLGLFLVRALVDRYRGTIEVADRVPGKHAKGARFIVKFPRAEGYQ